MELNRDETGDVEADGESGSDMDQLDDSQGPKPSTGPVSPLRLLGVALVLLLVWMNVRYLQFSRGGTADLEEVESTFFESVPEPVPYGLVLRTANVLASGEVWLTYKCDGEDEDLADSTESDAGVWDGETEPIRLTIALFPVGRAEDVLEEQFQKLRFESGDSGHGGGGRRGGRGGRRGGGDRGGSHGGGGGKGPELQDAGFVDWQGFSANYARLRHSVPSEDSTDDDDSSEDSASAASPAASDMEADTDDVSEVEEGPGDDHEEEDKEEGPAYDTIRVNLSTGGRCIIAYVRFPIGADGSKEMVLELLAGFKPLATASKY